MHCPRYTFAELTTGQIFKHFWAVSTPVTHLPGDSESEQDHFESHAAEMFGDGAWEPMEIENWAAGLDGVFSTRVTTLGQNTKNLCIINI